jgi:serine protease Do
MTPRIAITLLLLSASATLAQDVNDATEKAMKAAALKVAPTVVRIETTGGQDAIWGQGRKGPEVQFRRGTGATTGVVVDAGGYIITSSFNFIGKPTDIFVTVPGKPRAVAKVVAIDATRALTLLKIDQTGLPVPEAFPKKDLIEGMWSVALGRTLNPSLESSPSIHGGIISGVNRVWGKAVQSDAKISPVNYGGPLCAIDGKVIGVIAPISPTSEGEIAGFEWHDVGIGFAIPLEDIMRMLPKMKEGTADKPVTLRAGVMGVTFREPDFYTDGVTINNVSPDSPAQKAGLIAGDLILEIDGKPVNNQAQFLHTFRPKYEGDSVSLKVKRGDKTQEFKEIKLMGSQSTVDSGFLGILPMRDDPEAGVELRFVYPDSPAAKAGLKAGDRIMKVGAPAPKGGPKMPPGVPTGPQPFNGRDQFIQRMQNFPYGASVSFEVKKKEGAKTETLEIVLGKFPDTVPDELPEESTAKKALTPPKGAPGPKKEAPKKEEGKKEEPKKEEAKKEEAKKDDKVKTGLIKVTTEGTDPRNYWVFLPDNYDKNISHGLIVWFHPAGRDGRDADDMVKLWESFCEKHHFIMMGPTAGTNTGWVAAEADSVMDDVRSIRTQYTIDPQRVIAHGIGVGGQMAYYMAINKREVFKAAVPVGAILASNPKDPVAGQRVTFLVIAGAKDPIVKEIEGGYKKLLEKKYQAIYREMKVTGKEYVNDDDAIFREMVRWMDSLDRQ